MKPGLEYAGGEVRTQRSGRPDNAEATIAVESSVLGRVRGPFFWPLPPSGRHLKRFASAVVACLDRPAPNEPPDSFDWSPDRWNVQGDLNKVERTVDRPVHCEGQPAQRNIRGTAVEEELAIGGAYLGHQVGTMCPNLAPTFGTAPYGIQLVRQHLITGAFGVELLLNRFREPAHEFDVVFGASKLLSHLVILLSERCVSRPRFRQGQIRVVALERYLLKLWQHVAIGALKPTVRLTHRGELLVQMADGRPGLAEIPLTFLPLQSEALRCLLPVFDQRA